MDVMLRFASIVASACVCLPVTDASAAPQRSCSQRALHELEQRAPDGYAIYTAMPDKKFFFQWITCDNLQVDLATAVHESVHFLTESRDAYPLINGGAVKRPHEVSQFAPPAIIAKKFERGRSLFDSRSLLLATYLRHGGASSADDFLYLLDELNAYSHDLHAAVDLNGLHAANESAGERDGLAALMAFVAVYMATAEESQPATWSGLQKPDVADAISTLWTQAEKTMADSCGIPDLGQEDQYFLTKLCTEKPQASLQKILGRAPICPRACMQPKDKTADASPN
jgi:hypothetical protein